MSEAIEVTSAADLLQSLREAKEVPAVLKTKLASLRSTHPDVHVLAFEGVDDKIVYFHWLKGLAPNFRYEAIVCSSKAKVLAFRQLMERDQGDLRKNVYYFVDRDFDDLMGFNASDNLFMTDEYSVENYLVCEHVLEELLKVELHCHAEPAYRAKIVELFHTLYQDFFVLTKALNFRIFLSRDGVQNPGQARMA